MEKQITIDDIMPQSINNQPKPAYITQSLPNTHKQHGIRPDPQVPIKERIIEKTITVERKKNLFIIPIVVFLITIILFNGMINEYKLVIYEFDLTLLIKSIGIAFVVFILNAIL